MSQANVCNQALQVIGSRTQIVSIDEGSPEANALLIQWDSVRDQLLRSARWGFADKNLTASLLKAAPGTPENPGPIPAVWDSTTSPPLGWLYEYAYPSDCLMVRIVFPQSYWGYSSPAYPFPYFSYATPPCVPVKFITAMDTIDGVQQRVILTNARQAILGYTVRIDDVSVWDTSFEEAMVHALAGSVAFQLTGNPKLSEMLFQKANAVIMQARANDGNEALTTQDAPATWIVARDTYTTYWPNVGFFAPYGSLF